MLMHTLTHLGLGAHMLMHDEIQMHQAATGHPTKHPCLDVPASSYTQYLHRHIHTVRSLNSAVEWSFTH